MPRYFFFADESILITDRVAVVASTVVVYYGQRGAGRGTRSENERKREENHEEAGEREEKAACVLVPSSLIGHATLLSVDKEIRGRIVGTACKDHATPLSALSARNGDLGVVKKRRALQNKWEITRERKRKRVREMKRPLRNRALTFKP